MPQGAYLDFAASAPPRPEVRAAVAAAEAGAWANPSSPHGPGRRARAVVEAARAEVAALLGCPPDEVIFTSGATEANNLAVFGLAGAAGPGRRHAVVSAIEHHSVLEPCRALRRRGFAVQEVPPDGRGRVPAAAVAAALRSDTALCALMLANNEVGALQPVAEVASACRARGVPLLVDAVAAAGRVDVAGPTAGAAVVTLSAHKLGGQKGAGALRVARGVEILPPWSGGGQERGWRPGTEDVPAIAGFGAAARASLRALASEAPRLRSLEERLRAGLCALPLRVVGPEEPAERVPGLLSCVAPGLDGQALLVALDLRGVAAGSGAACTSGSLLPSHVLAAMGLPPQECRFPLRLSLGWCSTEADVDAALAALGEAVALQVREGAMQGGAGRC